MRTNWKNFWKVTFACLAVAVAFALISAWSGIPRVFTPISPLVGVVAFIAAASKWPIWD